MKQGLNTIEIGGVFVKLFKGKLTVEVEIDDEWVKIFSEKLRGEDHLIGHIIGSSGIADRAKNDGVPFQ